MIKKVKKPPMCFICRLNPPSGKCMMCGFRLATKDIDPSWRLEYEFQEQTHAKLKRHNMISTGDREFDLKLVRRFGSWHPELKVIRDANYKPTEIVYPAGYWEQLEQARLAKENNVC